MSHGSATRIRIDADLVETAREWIRNGGSSIQPWDRKDFKLPGGLPFSPQGMLTWAAAR